MEVLVEFVFTILQWFCELLLQLLAEGLAEFGLEAIREAVRPCKPAQPVLAVFGHALLGAIFALLSLWPFPSSFAHHAWLRIANLVITPIIAGFTMVTLGRWRMRRGQGGLYLHRFGYGLLFALTFGLVRFAFTR